MFDAIAMITTNKTVCTQKVKWEGNQNKSLQITKHKRGNESKEGEKWNTHTENNKITEDWRSTKKQRTWTTLYTKWF